MVMKKRSKFKNKLLALLAAQMGIMYAGEGKELLSSNDTMVNISKADFEDEQFAQLFDSLKVALDMIESAFDTIAQVRSTMQQFREAGISAEESNYFLLETRKHVAAFKDENSLYVNKLQVIIMADFVARVSSILDAMVKNGVDQFFVQARSFKPKNRSVVITPESLETLESSDIKKLVTEVHAELMVSLKKADEMGLSATNKVYRKVSSVWNRFGIGSILERAIMYPTILTWIVYRTDKDQIEKLPWVSKDSFLRRWLDKQKKDIGGEGKKGEPVKTELPHNVAYVSSDGQLMAHDDYVRVIKRNDDGSVDTKFMETDASSLYQIFKSKNPETTLSEQEFKQKYIKSTTTEHVGVLKDKQISEDGKLGNLAYALRTIVHITGDNLFKFPVDAIFANYLYKDFIKVKNNITKIKGIIDDKLRGSMKQRSWFEMATGTDRFKDVVGREDIKAELNKIIEYVCFPEKFDRTSITVEKGILFTGPSQNGKSAMVRAFINELSDALKRCGRSDIVPVFNIHIKDIIGPVVDPADGKIVAQFAGLSHFVRMAEAYGKPVVLVIDEFDMLSVQRDRDNKMLADVLTAMSSGLSASEKNMVIIIGLTNRPQNLDFALLQHGRFGKQFKFDKPTYKDRYMFFVKECERRMMDAKRFDIEKLARDTEGVSYGTLLSVTKRAFLLAKLANVGVTQAHFERALDTEVKNIQFEANPLPESKQRLIAAQQAGKALISYLIAPNRKLCKVTILPCVQEVQEENVYQTFQDKNPVFKEKEANILRYGNIFAYSAEDNYDMEIKEELIKQCKILTGGAAGLEVAQMEHLFDRQDKQEIIALARKIQSEGLVTLAGLPKSEMQALLEKAVVFEKECLQETIRLIKNHKKAFDALQAALLEKKILTYEDVEAIVKENR